MTKKAFYNRATDSRCTSYSYRGVSEYSAKYRD